MRLSSSSNKTNSKFRMSCRFVVVNASAKCEAPVVSSESVKTAFVHLDFPLILCQCSISAMLITPRVLNSLRIISESLASLSLLQLTKITFVLFVSAELNNKLSITNRYLYRLNLAKNYLLRCLLYLCLRGLIYHICQNFGIRQFLLGHQSFITYLSFFSGC